MANLIGGFFNKSFFKTQLKKTQIKLARLYSGDPSTSDIALLASVCVTVVIRPSKYAFTKQLKWPLDILILFSDFSSTFFWRCVF
ncbi:hypothetical protein EV06_0501 [Prochlorococcus sp. MIT 0602]|nr:hypothetical protein EV06_0501 [Prochlorococcus sp. MIT 0602]